ncbi:MAG: hypothetical protein IKT40_07420 [Bacilli bacterium]|nr:hypothetical protein [Bacilli bacterium]
MKQAIRKKDQVHVKPSISDIKSKLNMVAKSPEDLSKSSADKPMEFIQMPKAFEQALKLPGFPMGYMSIITGWSNTGKSTLKNCLIASCINNGILPVIYETENNFDFSYAIDCGMKATPIYADVEVEVIDEETGEIKIETERQIVDYEGDFIYYDSTLLAEQYGNNDYSTGKQTKTKRKVAVIEDIAYSINEILDLQDEGHIQQPICFIWDSVGSLPSFKSYSSKSGNNMFDAGALSVAFNTILNNRIPSSRRISNPYSNTFVCVNKIWNDAMNAMGGAVSIELKGGKTFTYSARLIVHMGGLSKAAVKKLSATAKGETYNYGIVSKIKVTKNQLPSPFNITYENELACVHNGLCALEDIDDYKKKYAKVLIDKLTSAKYHDKTNEISESDLQFVESEDIEIE